MTVPANNNYIMMQHCRRILGGRELVEYTEMLNMTHTLLLVCQIWHLVDHVALQVLYITKQYSAILMVTKPIINNHVGG